MILPVSFARAIDEKIIDRCDEVTRKEQNSTKQKPQGNRNDKKYMSEVLDAEHESIVS